MYTTSENFIKTETPSLCIANFSFQTSIKERLHKVEIPTVYATEICSVEPREERCGPLWKTIPPYESIEPQMVTNNEPKYYAVVNEPVVLKSIMKHQETKLLEIPKHNLEESISSSDNPFGELPDSLLFHEENNKKVHFSKNRKDNERILQAMSRFMEEATNLMTNLSLAANKLQKEQSFDLEVTVNDVHGLVDNTYAINNTKTLHDFQTQTCILEEASSQTSPKQSLDVASSTEPSFQIPLNKYEELVKESCDRLERCINKVEQQTCSKRIEQESLHKFPQPFSINSSVWNVVDDSSLESNITFSDYGSLPRQRQKRGPNCSPSAYLKQLTTMRKQIVESSRDDLVGQDKMHF
ncbi:hypothetical protein ILUMI_18477 [Ignelater luminosus]|uniref:Uncharacterized protein n=1 Tax=Ignelater luminosus TaxID=2038154 RepID=A0A8K0CMG3_IGNLU|nr:hypothetical protein ILUMI_18477 [Ignelater luminosus]